MVLILGWLCYCEIFFNVGRSALLWDFDISVGKDTQKSVPCNVEFGYQTRICFKKRTARNGTGLSEDPQIFLLMRSFTEILLIHS